MRERWGSRKCAARGGLGKLRRGEGGGVERRWVARALISTWASTGLEMATATTTRPQRHDRNDTTAKLQGIHNVNYQDCVKRSARF